MTGQNLGPAPRSPRQPGDRPPAPGTLAVVQAFVNTHFDLAERFGADLLSSPGQLEAWLGSVGLGPVGPLGAPDLARARDLREGLRALAAAGDDRARSTAALAALDSMAAGSRVALGFGPHGPTLSGLPGAGLAGATGQLLAIVARAMREGQWSRMKVCPGEHCGWLFYDGSRNRSGRWCSMSVCGGRAKARTHYRRTHGR